MSMAKRKILAIPLPDNRLHLSSSKRSCELKFEPSQGREHYIRDYDNQARWTSYWYQIREILETGSGNVLEVGIGNRTVSDYLRRVGLAVTTVDIDPELNPHYVCGVTELTGLFKPDSFDCVLCCQTLEHLSFRYFEKALDELYFISRDYVIISLPYFGIHASVSLRLPKIGVKVFNLRLPFPRHHHFDGEHHWEIGKRGYPLRKVVKLLEKKFTITKKFSPPENPYPLFFILRKRG